MAEEVRIHLFQTIKKWPIICVVVIIAIMFCINFYLFPEFRHTEMKDMCSPNHPDHAIVVHGAVNGTEAQTVDGTVYNDGQFWKDVYGKVHACPCSTKKPCVRKCCATDEVFNITAQCVKVRNMSTIPSFTNTLDTLVYTKSEFLNQLIKESVASNHFSVLPSCPQSRPVTKKNIMNQRVYLFNDGHLWAKYYNAFILNSRYCLEFMPRSSDDNAELEVYFALCRSTAEEVEWEVWIIKSRRLFRHTVQIVCMLLYLATFSVFALQPNIRKGYGRWLMCFQAARFIKVFELLNIFQFNLEHDNFCVFTVIILQYSELASQAWQLVIYFHIWTAMRPDHISDLGPVCSYNSKRFMYFSAIAWGIPLIIVAVVTTVTELAVGPDCWYNNRATKTLYMTAPHVLTDLVNLVLCVKILRSIRTYKRDSATLPPNNIRHYNAREIQWSGIYVQFSMVISANFLLLSVLMMIDRVHHVVDFIYYTMEQIDVMRGIDVFFIFVCHRSQLSVIKDSFIETWHYILGKIPKVREGRFSPN